ncbi:MAG: peptidase T [Ruminococcaceae bacterium]|nr:peptidase T [Oscillospiraceae bacterium]
MNAAERFLKYVKIHTTSDETTKVRPSTPGQIEFAKMLACELESIGAENIRISDGCVYASIGASEGCENLPAIGLIAHMDTAPDVSGENVNPQIIESYGGDDITLANGLVMRVCEYPELADCKGLDLIVTDGNTLLGSDDKAGVAEIMSAAEKIIKENIPHGKICIAFTPDEEIGEGADGFDVEGFGAQFAYTVDGGALGEIEYENFNAASASIKITGVNIHPGSAKNKMINASLIAVELASMLPEKMTPAHTEGYEGFFHLTGINSSEELAEMHYIIRDHDREKFEQKKSMLADIVRTLNEKYADRIELCTTDSYYNMREMVEPHPEIIDRAKSAMTACGVEPRCVPIRGGTDGARLSFMGLPCPNLSTGGYNFHGRFEYIPVQSIEKMVEVLIEIVRA